MMYVLRDYQKEAIDKIMQCVNRGKKRILVAMATGLGKTVIFASLPKVIGTKKRWLVLAHRKELLDQAAKKFETINPGLSIGVEQSDRTAGNARIVVASVQTMQRKRLKGFDPSEFGVVICDEAHHSVAKSYHNIFEYFGVSDPSADKILLGVTATPNRGDDVGLGNVYDDIAYEYLLHDAIEDGWLCNINGKSIKTKTDLSNVGSRMGDFIVSQLAEAIDSPSRNKLIVERYIELADQRKTLAFCVNVEHAESLCEAFKDKGVHSSVLTGKTPPVRRKHILDMFKQGKIKVLCNCGVLTEGFDDPDVSCILMARPTRSSTLYTQIIGRGTRPARGKADCLILDFSDSCKSKVQSLPSLFGLPSRMNTKDPVGDVKKIEEFQIEHPWINLDKLKDVKDLKYVVKDLNFFVTKPPDLIEKFTKFQWIKTADGYRLNLPKREKVEIIPTRLGTFQIFATSNGIKKMIDERTLLREAVRSADESVKRARKSVVKLIDLKQKWRDKKPTKYQLSVLKRIGIDFPSGINRGQASAIINAKRV